MITVCALNDLEATASSLGDYRLLTLMSPSHPDDSWKHHARDAHLHLAFHDIAEPRDGLIAPGRDDVAAILAFGCDASPAKPLLIHCWAGISRSSAAAYIIACAENPSREHDIAPALRKRAPFATANPLMIALADDLLSRDGRMIAAIRTIGRGAEAFAGLPYTLPLTYPTTASTPSKNPISPTCSIAPSTSPV
jgi:predicted protein tyrosine phosphatase